MITQMFSLVAHLHDLLKLDPERPLWVVRVLAPVDTARFWASNPGFLAWQHTQAAALERGATSEEAAAEALAASRAALHPWMVQTPAVQAYITGAAALVQAGVQTLRVKIPCDADPAAQWAAWHSEVYTAFLAHLTGEQIYRVSRAHAEAAGLMAPTHDIDAWGNGAMLCQQTLGTMHVHYGTDGDVRERVVFGPDTDVTARNLAYVQGVLRLAGVTTP